MRYPRYLRILDSIGFVSLCSAIVFVLLPQSLRPDNHIENLWGNLSTELIGMWIAVRFIDWSIKYHERHTKLRVRVVRHMRYVERLFNALREFQKQQELRTVQKELRWGRERLEVRKKCLSNDEILDVLRYYQLADELLSLVNSPSGHSEKTRVEFTNMTHFNQKLHELEEARQTADQNILAETDEDEGIT